MHPLAILMATYLVICFALIGTIIPLEKRGMRAEDVPKWAIYLANKTQSRYLHIRALAHGFGVSLMPITIPCTALNLYIRTRK